MKKILFVTVASALTFAFLSSLAEKVKASDPYMQSYIASRNYQVEQSKKNAKKYCAASNFNADKCEDACKYVGNQGFDKPSICNNLKNPPQTNLNPTALAPVVKKNILVDALAKLKNQWKLQREGDLLKFKAEKDKLKQDFKDKFTTERCAKIQERINNQESNFNGIEGKHTQVYTNLVNRLNKFIARFDAAKLDTTTIKSHLAVLQTKIDKFKEDYAAYLAKLKESKNLTCGHSEGEFKGVLLEAKALLKTVHDDAADIRTYVRETIFADLKALKSQMPKDEESSSSSSSSSSSEAGTENSDNQ